MDDISEEDDLCGPILAHQGSEPIRSVIVGGDWKQLPRVAMRPDIAQVEIRYHKGTLPREPKTAPRIQMQAGCKDMDMRWLHQTGDSCSSFHQM